MTDCEKDNCEMSDIDKQISGEILDSCSHAAILLYLKSEKRKPFLRAMEKYNYKLKIVKK